MIKVSGCFTFNVFVSLVELICFNGHSAFIQKSKFLLHWSEISFGGKTVKEHQGPIQLNMSTPKDRFTNHYEKSFCLEIVVTI